MNTAQKIQKLEKEMQGLHDLFSALVPLDKEGEYKDSFVKEMSKLAKEKPEGTYDGKGSLLRLR
ncbi:MAG: hypothetical protein KBC35_02045 [Candidatus Pacebacteria bacterium]|nr:hypothetical protein [Candidatus Paceibacterota bacterium]